MIDKSLVDQARRVNLIDLVRQSVELRRESATEWSGPCVLCGGDDRLHVKASGFFCRNKKCWPDGSDRFGDPIEYARWLHRLNFAEAVQRLTGDTSMHTTTMPRQARQPAQPVKKAPKQSAQSPDWAAKVQPMVTAAQDHAEDATAHLASRAIAIETAIFWQLGYRPDAPLPGTWDATDKRHIAQPQPAIVIPWYRAGKLCAVRYRFFETHTYTDVDGKQRKAKLTAVPGSDFTGLLYGGHMLPSFCLLPSHDNGRCAEQLRTLVIVEGEINAISIWQVAHAWRWDVLSLGSESQKLPDGGRKLAERYGRVIVWMDKADIAKQTMSQITGAVAISSPVMDERKVDANDMLQTGQLAKFLAEARQRACQSEDERERVKWDLWEVGRG